MVSGPSSKFSVSSSLILGVFAVAWAAIVSLACVPWFIRLLGIESYGLIGFYVTLQAAVGLLDLGLGATINREVARSAALDDLDRARRLLRSLEFVYTVVAITVFVAIAFAAPLIADKWLGPSTLDRADMNLAIGMMGLVAALRWPISLYLGTLIGLQRAQVSYRLTATMATVSNVGAVLVLLYVDRTIWAYFVWQSAAALLYVIWARWSAWRTLGGSHSARFDGGLLGGVLIRSAVMSGVAMSGLILTQLDKFMVSSSTALADFGRYSLAVVLASGLSVLIIPTFNIIYPRLSALFAAGEPAERIRFYRLGTRLFLSCLFPIALSAFFYARDLLLLWTGDASLAMAAAPIAGLLCLGAALNGMMHFPYALQLAAGRTKLPLLINCAMLAIMLPLALVLVKQYGALGGAISVLSLNAIYVVIGVTVTHVYLLPGLQKQWMFRDVAPALIVATVIVSAGDHLVTMTALGPVLRLAFATICSLAATAILLFVYRDARYVLREAWSAATARLRSVKREAIS